MSYEFKSIYFDNPIIQDRVIDIFMPSEVQQPASLFLVHGGGWAAGSRTCMHKIMRAFNQQGYICATTDYRLAGSGVNILDQIEDIRYGYLLFLQYLKQLQHPLNIFTFGSSAGSHLNALLSFAGPGECGEKTSSLPDINWVPPIGAAFQATPIRFEPWEDIFPGIWASMQNIVNVPYDENPELYQQVAPYNYLSSESCPAFFLEAENEHMFPLEFILEAVRKLKSCGVRAEYKIYTKAEHGFFYDIIRRQQKEAFTDILNFIKSL